MKRLLAASTLAAVLPAPAVADKPAHRKGCHSRPCDRRIDRAWARKHRDREPQALAVASYYGPGLYGNHLACGGTLEPNTFGVAHKALPCGTKIRLCVRRCVTVGGRTFDLTASVKNAIGAAPLSTVRYRVIG
jgi:hypothetical protein